MSELIAFIHSETQLQKVLEDTRRQYTKEDHRWMIGGADPWGSHVSSPLQCQFSTTLGFTSTPSLQVGLI